MAGHNHTVILCRICKKMIAQCRCMTPPTVTEYQVCEECKKKPQPVKAQTDYTLLSDRELDRLVEEKVFGNKLKPCTIHHSYDCCGRRLKSYCDDPIARDQLVEKMRELGYRVLIVFDSGGCFANIIPPGYEAVMVESEENVWRARNPNPGRANDPKVGRAVAIAALRAADENGRIADAKARG